MSYYCPFHPEQELDFDVKINAGYCSVCKKRYNRWGWKLKERINDGE